jgi:hypothetical protein
MTREDYEYEMPEPQLQEVLPEVRSPEQERFEMVIRQQVLDNWDAVIAPVSHKPEVN